MISTRALTVIMALTSVASLYLIWRGQRSAPPPAPSVLLPPVGAYPSGSEVFQ